MAYFGLQPPPTAPIWPSRGQAPPRRVRASSAALPEDHRGIQATGHEAPGAPLGCVAPREPWKNYGFIIFYNGNNIES